MAQKKRKNSDVFAVVAAAFHCLFATSTIPDQKKNAVDIAKTGEEHTKQRSERGSEHSYRHKIQSFNFSKIPRFSQMQRNQSTVTGTHE